MLVCEVLHTLSGPNDAAPAVCARPCRPPHSIRRRATGDAAVAEGRCAAGSRSGYVRSGSNSAVRRSAQCPVCPRTDMAAIRAAKAAGFKKPVIVARHRIVHETSPLSKTPAISRFSRRARPRFRFCAKRREIASRLGWMGRRDGGPARRGAGAALRHRASRRGLCPTARAKGDV
jgi:hypothetical protein